MNILFTPSINFNAKRVKSPKIGTNDKSLTIGSNLVNSSIVEVDVYNAKNVSEIEDAVDLWTEKAFYGKQIVDSAKNQRKRQQRETSKIYALTLQQDNFKVLDSNQILGLGEVTQKGKSKVEINYLQVEPKIAGKNANKRYFDVGSSIVRMLQWKPEIKEITVQADYRAANFYEKMGFKIRDLKTLTYVWKRMRGVRIPKH